MMTKRLASRLAVLVAVTALAASATAAPVTTLADAESGPYLTYQSARTGLSFEYPAHWVIEETDSLAPALLIQDSGDGDLLSGVVFLFRLTTGASGKEVTDLVLPEVLSLPEARLASVAEVSLADDLPASRALYSFGPKHRSGGGFLLVAVREELVLVLNVTMSWSSLASSTDDLQHLVQTLQLSDPEGEPNEIPTWEWSIYDRTTSGISSDVVMDLAEDSSGRLWFATQGGGTSRLDGEMWNSFTTENTQIPSDRLLAVTVDKDDRIWVGTDGVGVGLLEDKKWQTFDTTNSGLAHDLVFALHQDQRGRMWFGTWGGGVSLLQGDFWTTYATQNTGLAHNKIRAILEDSSNRLWFATWGGGVSVLDTEARVRYDLKADPSWTTYDTENSPLGDNRVRALFEDSRGAVWVATYGGGVSRFADGAWETFNAANSGLPDDFTLSVIEDSNGDILVGTRFQGVARFNGSQATTPTPTPTEEEQVGEAATPAPTASLWATDGRLGNLQVEAFFRDSQERLWFTTNGGGVVVQDGEEQVTHSRATAGLTNDTVYTLFEDSRGRMWFGTLGGGAAVLDGGSWTTYTPANSGLLDTWVTAILEDSQGHMWFGTFGGGVSVLVEEVLNGEVPDGKEWTTYTRFDGLSSDFVLALAEDLEGNIWATTSFGGANFFDGDSWTQYTTVTSEIAANTVWSVVVDRQGSVWFATEGGVSLLTGTDWLTYNTANSSLRSNVIYWVAEDSIGQIWVATRGGAGVFDGQVWLVYTQENSAMPTDVLFHANPIGQDQVLFGTADAGAVSFDGASWITLNTDNSGLPNNSVNAIIQDTQGNLWFATLGGGSARYAAPALGLGLILQEAREWVAGTASQGGGSLGPQY